MEEILGFPRMMETNLINRLEKISFRIPSRILKLKGYVLKKNHNEELEIIIFKGISSSTTHRIEMDLEKKVLDLDYVVTNVKLYKSPLTDKQDNFIRENKNSAFFLNEKNWI